MAIGGIYVPTQQDTSGANGATVIAWGDSIFNQVGITFARTDHPDKALGFIRGDLGENTANMPWLYTSAPFSVPGSSGSIGDIALVTDPNFVLLYVARANSVFELGIGQAWLDPHVYPPIWGQTLTVLDPRIRTPPSWNSVVAKIGTGKFNQRPRCMKADTSLGVLGVIFEYTDTSAATPVKIGYAAIQLAGSGQPTTAGGKGFNGTTSGTLVAEVFDLPNLTYIQRGHDQKPNGTLCYQSAPADAASGNYVAVDMASGSYEVIGEGFATLTSINRKDANGDLVHRPIEAAWDQAIIDSDAYSATYMSWYNDPAADPEGVSSTQWPFGPFKVRVGGASIGKTAPLVDLLKWAGVSAGYTTDQISITGLDGIMVFGALITEDTDLESFLASMSKVYDFDYYNSGSKLVVVRREDELNSDPVATYTVADLIPLSDSKTVETKRIPPSQIANSVSIQYLDADADFAQLSQTYKRDTFPIMPRNVVQADPVTYTVPVVIDAQDAATAALRAVYQLGTQNITNEFMVAWPGLTLEPTDIVKVDFGGFDYLVKLNEATINGDLSVSLAGTNFSKRFNGQVLGLPTAPPTTPATGIIHSRVLYFDMPSLVPGETLVYIKSYMTAVPLIPGPWNGATLFKAAAGAEFEVVGPVADPPPYAIVNNKPSDIVEPWATDTENVLQVQVCAGDPPEACTEDEARSGTNMALWGDSGRWEYIAFSGVDKQDDGSYLISGLLRGRNGTEMFVNTHHRNDVLIMVDQFTTFEFDYSSDDLGKSLVVAASNTGSQSASDIDVYSTTLTAAAQKPFAPANPFMTGTGDRTIGWYRRDRVLSTFVSSGTEIVPLSEASELYDLEITLDGTVVRTATGLTEPSFMYTVAMQAADGVDPTQGVAVNIYQISALVGRGFPCSKVVYDR